MSKKETNWSKVEQIVEAVLQSADAMLKHFLFYGPPGTSKTYVATHMGVKKGEPLWLLSLTCEQPASELRGNFAPTAEGGLGWFDGPCISWWKQGGRLVLDELDQMSPECDSFLRVVLNDPDVAVMTLPNGETVRRERHAKYPHTVVATMNGLPEELSPAVRDRFLAFEVTVPHPGAFELLREELREPARRSYLTGQTERLISLRDWQRISGLVGMLEPEEAFKAVLGEEQGGAAHDSCQLSR